MCKILCDTLSLAVEAGQSQDSFFPVSLSPISEERVEKRDKKKRKSCRSLCQVWETKTVFKTMERYHIETNKMLTS